MTAGALLLVAVAAVVTLGGTAAWARSGIQFASFAIAALGTGWLIASERTPRVTAAIVLSTAIPMWGALQLMLGTSVSDYATRNAILDSAAFTALFFIAGQTLENREVRRRLLNLLFLLAFLVSAGALLWPRMPVIDRTDYCIFVELLLPVGLYRICTANRRHSAYIWAVLSAVVVASGLITGSGVGCGLIAAETAAVPVVAVVQRRASVRHTWIPIAAMLALIAIFAAGVGREQLTARFASGDPAGGRSELVASAVNMARDRPWTGFGLGSFEAAYPTYALIDNGRRVNHAYNDWAEWTATGGLPLLAMYLAVFGLTLPLLVRHPWAIGVAAMCLHALARFPFEIPALMVLNAILMGAAASGDE